MERKSRARAESAGFVAIVAIALVLVNLLAIKFFTRLDLTKRQLFTLSDGTRNIIQGRKDPSSGQRSGGLTDQLTITVFFTANQPPPANDDERFLHDQLDEYRALAPNRIAVKYVVPDNESRQTAAKDAGCEEQTLQAVDAREEQATIRKVFRCITFEYLGKKEKIEFLPPGVQGLEYEISSIIKGLTGADESQPTIGFLTGHGELTPEEGMNYLSQIMEQQRVRYKTKTVNLTNGDTDVPDDIKGLIIANPTQRISEKEGRRLDKYLMGGGAIAVFAGGLNFPSTDPTMANGTPAEHHLNDWLEGYGIHIENNVILDTRSTDGVVRMGRQSGRVRLVTWPVIAALSGLPSESDLKEQGGLNPAYPAVFRLPEVITTYPSSITINKTMVDSGGGAMSLFARTGPRSVLRTDNFDLNIVEILQHGRELFENASNHGPYVVGVALEKEFHSAYVETRRPGIGGGNSGSSDGGDSADASAPEENNAEVARVSEGVSRSANRNARLMVVSSGSIFALDTLRVMAQLSGGAPPANLTFLLNTFDWLSSDTDLLGVRAKDTSEPGLRADVSDTAKGAFKWGSVVFLPLAIGAFGLAITAARRNRRKNYTTEYGASSSR